MKFFKKTPPSKPLVRPDSLMACPSLNVVPSTASSCVALRECRRCRTMLWRSKVEKKVPPSSTPWGERSGQVRCVRKKYYSDSVLFTCEKWGWESPRGNRRRRRKEKKSSSKMLLWFRRVMPFLKSSFDCLFCFPFF